MIDDDPTAVAVLRSFNRIYTRRLGFLNDKLDNSAFALTDARVLYELVHNPGCIAADIARLLGLDPAQLSRILKRFMDEGLLERAGKGRNRPLAVTPAGHAAFAELKAKTESAIGELLTSIPPTARARMIACARTMSNALEGRVTLVSPGSPITLRNLRIGDIGWITHRQACLYHEEYGWDVTYEALAADILAGFVKTFDPAREAAWIAEQEGNILGSVFLMRDKDEDTARLRLLYVEPTARGVGLGRRLVEVCIAEARAMRYRQLTLWTNSVLTSARKIYEAAGFELTDQEPHHSFGADLVGQTWMLTL
jgi:DNA-binding MarR family transcriptional regulator/N-acetylglutamate synthase-like GNAT family acetyltransferase